MAAALLNYNLVVYLQNVWQHHGQNTYMLFSKALLLSSSVSAAADHWLEVSSIKTEPLSSGRTLVD